MVFVVVNDVTVAGVHMHNTAIQYNKINANSIRQYNIIKYNTNTEQLNAMQASNKIHHHTTTTNQHNNVPLQKTQFQ